MDERSRAGEPPPRLDWTKLIVIAGLAIFVLYLIFAYGVFDGYDDRTPQGSSLLSADDRIA